MLQISYMTATEICTVGPTDGAVKVTSCAFVTNYVYDYQHGKITFFKTSTLIVPTVLCGWKMHLSSEVKRVDLV